MKKGFQRAACILLAALMAAAFPACKKKDKVESFSPSFAIKDYENGDYRFSIPDAWGQVADPTGSGVLVFAGKEAYEEGGFNNVSVCIYEIENKAAAPEDVEAAFQEGFEARVKESCPEAAGFSYGKFKTSAYTVFTAEYKVPAGDRELAQKVYYPLIDSRQVYVAACDTGAEGISADEAAKEIIHTLRVGIGKEASEAE